MPQPFELPSRTGPGHGTPEQKTLASEIPAELLTECAEVLEAQGKRAQAELARSLAGQVVKQHMIEQLYLVGRLLCFAVPAATGQQPLRCEAITLAARIFEQVLAMYGAHVKARRDLALSYLELGRYREAVGAGRYWVAFVTGDERAEREALFTLALAQLFNGRAEEAVFTFKRMTVSFPQAPEPHLGFGLAFSKLQETARLAQEQAALESLDPEMGQILLRLSAQETWDYATLGREINHRPTRGGLIEPYPVLRAQHEGLPG